VVLHVSAPDDEDDSGSLSNDLQVSATTRLLEALVESENRMRTRVDLLSEVVFELDADRNIVFLNRAWTTLLGLQVPAARGRPLRDHVLPSDQAGFDQAFDTAGPDNAARQSAFRFCGMDGSVRWMELSVVAPKAGGYFGALKDVTWQKSAQDELERMSLVATLTDNLVLITDAQGRVEWANDAFIRHTGYTLAEVQGKVPGSVLQGPQTDPAEVARIGRELRAGRSFRAELLNYTKGGRSYWITMFITPVRNAAGELLRYIAVQSDSTRLRSVKDALEREKLRAEAASAAKSDFLSVMSHELRTPLNGILGMAELLQMPGATAQDQREYAAIIHGAGQSLLGILNDILELSKIEAGKMELRPVAFSPAALLREVQLFHRSAAQAKGLALYAHWDGGLAEAYLGDPLRFRQILNNLVSNAVKFTALGSVRIEGREVSRDAHVAVLEFAVTDTGIGIAKDKQGLLFQPFSQIDNSSTRSAGGTGLGLSIVRRLAEMMGGSVRMDSEPGRGTWVTVQMQVERAPALATDSAGQATALPDAAPTDAPALQAGFAEPVVPGSTAEPVARSSTAEPVVRSSTAEPVLVVEDNPVNALVLKTFLHKLGFAYHHAENGLEALRYLEHAERPMLILMDCQMPVMDGYEATTRIRSLEAQSGAARIPIIAITASAFEEDRNRCMAVGMDGFLAKPMAFEQLRSILEPWVSGAH